MQQYSLSILETLETYSSWDDVWKTGSGNSKREKSIEMNVISCVKRYFDGVANRNIDSIDCQSLPLLKPVHHASLFFTYHYSPCKRFS